MKNLAVINLAGLSPLACTSILNDESSLERVFNWACEIPLYGGKVLLADEDEELSEELSRIEKFSQEALVIIRHEEWNEKIFVESLHEASQYEMDGGEKPGNLFFVWGDCPLLDTELCKELWDIHYKYDAQYSFADGYPGGLAPEILSSQLPYKLYALAQKRNAKLNRESLFEILRQDINAFDIETHLSPVDLRSYRVALNCASRRNRNIIRQLYNAGGANAASICKIIPQRQDLLRDLPAYFPVQITNHCPQSCSYCPFPVYGGDPREGKGYMNYDKFCHLCERIVRFAGDAVISLSLWGEPSSHPRITDLIMAAIEAGKRDSRNFSTRVLIETSGLGWKTTDIEFLAEKYKPGQIMWIVSLDASLPELYKKLRGKGQEEAEAFALQASRLFKTDCWVQAVRMDENEGHLDDFYKKWTDLGGQVIIQKYNNYAAYIPNRQPSDLSPINRHPCWHLKRDMPILIDGSVPVCREDLSRRDNLGNVFSDNLEDIWVAGQELYKQHIGGKFTGPCSQCDEYYTFNF